MSYPQFRFSAAAREQAQSDTQLADFIAEVELIDAKLLPLGEQRTQALLHIQWELDEAEKERAALDSRHQLERHAFETTLAAKLRSPKKQLKQIAIEADDLIYRRASGADKMPVDPIMMVLLDDIKANQETVDDVLGQLIKRRAAAVAAAADVRQSISGQSAAKKPRSN